MTKQKQIKEPNLNYKGKKDFRISCVLIEETDYSQEIWDEAVYWNIITDDGIDNKGLIPLTASEWEESFKKHPSKNKLEKKAKDLFLEFLELAEFKNSYMREVDLDSRYYNVEMTLDYVLAPEDTNKYLKKYEENEEVRMQIENFLSEFADDYWHKVGCLIYEYEQEMIEKVNDYLQKKLKNCCDYDRACEFFDYLKKKENVNEVEKFINEFINGENAIANGYIDEEEF